MSFDEQISAGAFKKIHVWSEEETKQMLDYYSVYLEETGPLRKFRNKKDMWSQIANDLGSKTAKQCEERYKTVMKRRKTAIENNSTSRSKRQRIEFEQVLEKPCPVDDPLAPEVRLSSHHKSKKKKVDSPSIKKNKTSLIIIAICVTFLKRKKIAKTLKSTSALSKTCKDVAAKDLAMEGFKNMAEGILMRMSHTKRRKTIKRLLDVLFEADQEEDEDKKNR